MTNEKRLEALAELQADGERMEKGFDLEEWIASFSDMTPHLRACMVIAYEKGRQQMAAEMLAKLKAKFSGTMFEANVMSRVKDILEGK